jgi:hypothetical protein
MTTPEEDEASEVAAVVLEATMVGELLPPCQLNMDILKSVAMHVAGRKTAVITASTFIAELSLVAETAKRAAKRLSSWAILLLSCGL